MNSIEPPTQQRNPGHSWTCVFLAVDGRAAAGRVGAAAAGQAAGNAAAAAAAGDRALETEDTSAVGFKQIGSCFRYDVTSVQWLS